MTSSEEYILESIQIWVWSGFYELPEILDSIEDILEEDADLEMLRAAARDELGKKLEAEKSWPAITDCDRLDLAFKSLEAQGLIVLQNPGMTMDDGLYEVGELLSRKKKGEISGYCFYHGQDLERAVQGMGLFIAFGDLANTSEGKTSIGNLLQSELEKNGFKVEWSGDPEKRLKLPEIDWKRRQAPAS